MFRILRRKVSNSNETECFLLCRKHRMFTCKHGFFFFFYTTKHGHLREYQIKQSVKRRMCQETLKLKAVVVAAGDSTGGTVLWLRTPDSTPAFVSSLYGKHPVPMVWPTLMMPQGTAEAL